MAVNITKTTITEILSPLRKHASKNSRKYPHKIESDDLTITLMKLFL